MSSAANGIIDNGCTLVRALHDERQFDLMTTITEALTKSGYGDPTMGGLDVSPLGGENGARLALSSSDSSPAAAVVEHGQALAKALRDERRFNLLTTIAEALIERGYNDPTITRLYAQGLIDSGQYTFIVLPEANKTQIKIAVEQIFNVKVHSVNTINRQGKRKRSRGTQMGKRKDTKRAIVSLAPGERIEIFGGPGA